jgi:hypothetical protein
MKNSVGYGLNAEVREFIRQKVQQLGSIRTVIEFYPGTCLVDKYAYHIACEIYSHYNSLTTREQQVKSKLKLSTQIPAIQALKKKKAEEECEETEEAEEDDEKKEKTSSVIDKIIG